MAQLRDPHYPCLICLQPTDNLNLCDSCIENLKRYEADLHSKLEPRRMYSDYEA